MIEDECIRVAAMSSSVGAYAALESACQCNWGQGVCRELQVGTLSEAQSEYVSNGPVIAPMFSVRGLGGSFNMMVQVARQRPQAALYRT